MKKNILPAIIFLSLAVGLAGFIVYRTMHAISYEDAFESTTDAVCTGFSRSRYEDRDYVMSTYARYNPQMTVVLNNYRRAKAASNAFDERTIYGIGIVPEGGYIQNFGHQMRVYFIHDHTGIYYCCGIVGDKLVFGMKSDDGNYFSRLFTDISDYYSAFCVNNGI